MRAVYIGGFGNGRQCSERVASALRAYYDIVDSFTFSYAMTHQDEIHMALRGADAITHSAGMLAIAEASPNKIYSFGAPLPTPIYHFPGKSITKNSQMHRQGVGIQSLSDVKTVKDYQLSSSAELLFHPISNFGRLKQISRFNAIDAAILAAKNDIPISLAYMQWDEFFQLSEAHEAAALAAGVSVVRLAGVHDELVLRPEKTLRLAGFTAS
ncbi:MAG TPA: hypothetical protein VMR45_05540 [Patescibacteria group bacterium]|nr:hypothetical protein [Patescibacteria group bacterium]